ncbi:ABC transporter ATP-binding protein [Kallotenue papyrolyticum]|uniref:ABC transporter ATP-binding protein n=1 Tax=Kallotenue papyrolyticum TaxID=1325125 RepID=UPI000478589C|nr:ABC transporter ATP-binding protein [Kallotenue papyrolyticum]
MAPHETPLELQEVVKIYPGQVRALDGVSLRLASGERAALLGPNGAGKTTIIRLLTGALTPTRGRVALFGTTTHAADFLAAKRRVGVVPQGPGMYRDLTVGEYLQFVRELYGRGDPARVIEVFGLDAYLERRMAALSGGYQRRLALAAALLPAPDLLLLDEPTVGLDPVATREVHTFLQQMITGRSVLLCTHNLAEAEALCDSVLIIRGGRVLVHAPIAQLRRRAQPQLELAAREGVAALSHALQSRGYVPEIVDRRVRITVAAPEQEAPALLRTLLDMGLNVYECHTLTPSLEDVFLDVVGAAHGGA